MKSKILAALLVLSMVGIAWAGPLTWERPAFNTDGSTYDDHAYYKVYYGDGIGSLNDHVVVMGETTALDNPPPATYYCVAAMDTSGNESECSNICDIVAPVGPTCSW